MALVRRAHSRAYRSGGCVCTQDATRERDGRCREKRTDSRHQVYVHTRTRKCTHESTRPYRYEGSGSLRVKAVRVFSMVDRIQSNETHTSHTRMDASYVCRIGQVVCAAEMAFLSLQRSRVLTHRPMRHVRTKGTHREPGRVGWMGVSCVRVYAGR